MLIRSLFFLFFFTPCLAEEVETPATFYRKGEEAFFKGEIQQAIDFWDQELALQPRRAPYHWQRGLALYYADEFKKGAEQFTIHQTVNGHDVENAVWHFLCVVKTKEGTIELARKKFIPIEGDARVPMSQIHDLFANETTPEAVLAVCKTRNHFCYAHLYLGLYFEALGKNEKAIKHIKKSAVDFKMDHYMGKVAQIHLKLRQHKK